ncbi:MAG: NlpC/P60 family protein [Actinobacteria bacterium]|nr:NlpC/P60 family protein [Actinomycetota bacterium]
MVKRSQIVDEARAWLGTPFSHQGRSRSGVDCSGLVICVGKSLGLLDGYVDSGYARQPDPDNMLEKLSIWGDKIHVKDALPGDVLWFRFIQPMHLGILTDFSDGQLGLIHSYYEANGCVEHSLDNVWKKRVVSAFRFRGVDD